MTTEVKFSGRTYGKSQQESAASKAFDEVFSKPKAKNMKWGNASFVKPRTDEENEPKRAKIEEPSDPFSFEFDGDRSPDKKRRIQPVQRGANQPAVRYVVPSTTQPAVRIKTDLQEDDEDDLVVRRAPTKTYTKKSSRKVKLENDSSQQKIDSFIKKRQNSEEDTTDLSQNTDLSQEIAQSSEEISEDIDTDLYIEKDDGSSVDVKDTSFIKNEEDDIFKKRKKDDDNEITVRFRSRYLDPDVYSKFTENVSPRDPVGRLSNSKVVHSNVLKHDAGTTLIVVCSPKVETDIKHTNVETKYFNKTEKKTERKTRSKTKAQESQKEQTDPKEKQADNLPQGGQIDNQSASQEENMEVESSADALINISQESEQAAMAIATPVVVQSEPSSQVSEPVDSSSAGSQEKTDSPGPSILTSQSSSGSSLPKIIIRNKRTVTTVSKEKPVVSENKVVTAGKKVVIIENKQITDENKQVTSSNKVVIGEKRPVTGENKIEAGDKNKTEDKTSMGRGKYFMNVNKSSVTALTPQTQAPARKYHRIFRSRNKALPESSQETTSSQPESQSATTTPDNSQRSEGEGETSGVGSQESDLSGQSQQSSQEESQSQQTGSGQEDQDVGKTTFTVQNLLAFKNILK